MINPVSLPEIGIHCVGVFDGRGVFFSLEVGVVVSPGLNSIVGGNTVEVMTCEDLVPLDPQPFKIIAAITKNSSSFDL